MEFSKWKLLKLKIVSYAQIDAAKRSSGDLRAAFADDMNIAVIDGSPFNT